MWFDLTPIQHDLIADDHEYVPIRKFPKQTYDPNWREPTICPWCNQELVRKSYSQRYHPACATAKERARSKTRERNRPAAIACANPACGKMFVPRGAKQTECCQNCRVAVGKRRNY